MEDSRLVMQNEALVNALAGLGDAEGLEAQESWWATRKVRERRLVTESRARHPELRRAALERALADEFAEVRQTGLELILDGPQEAFAAVDGLLNDKSEKVRRLAQQVVDWTPPATEAELPTLAVQLGDPDQAVRHRARDAILRGRWQTGVEPVLAMLSHPTPQGRNNALQALTYPHSSLVILDSLLALFDRDDSRSQEALSRALGCFQDKERLARALHQRINPAFPRRTTDALYALAWARDASQRAFMEDVASQWPKPIDSNAGVLGLELMGGTESITLLRALLGAYDERDPEQEYDESALED